MSSIDVEAADVSLDGVQAGKLERIQAGSRFVYDDAFLARADKPKHGLAIQLPYEASPIETHGVNLHPFFAGLLPEGLRLQAILGAARTSPDDLFTLLIAAGPDCVGDVYALPEGSKQEPSFASIDLSTLEDADFTEAKHRLLEGAREASIPGVQPKFSAAVLSLPVGRSKTRAASILKLSPAGYPKLVENEALIMEAARRCELRVPKWKIVRDRQGVTGFLVERFDRLADPPPGRLGRVHQEDACQFLGRYPADKYRISMRQIAEAISTICDAPRVQLLRLLELYVFSYLIGNADLHSKNISIYRNPSTKLLELTPAYDLVSTLPYGQLDADMALSLEGKSDNFKLADFVGFFGRVGIPEQAVRASVGRIVRTLASIVQDIDSLGYEPRDAARTKQIIRRRLERLSA